MVLAKGVVGVVVSAASAWEGVKAAKVFKVALS